MKKILINFVFLLMSLILLFYILKNTDIQTNTYLNKQEVLKNNAIQKGWIPNILPNSAYDIIETHNIDTNKIYGSFKYLQKDEIFLTHLASRYKEKGFTFKINKKKNKVKFYSSP